MLPPVLQELVRLMPPTGTVWAMEKRVVWFIAFDAAMSLVYGREPNMIWIGKDGEIKIASRPPEPCKHGIDDQRECGLCHDEQVEAMRLADTPRHSQEEK